jgi:hypothetical protein
MLEGRTSFQFETNILIASVLIVVAFLVIIVAWAVDLWATQNFMEAARLADMTAENGYVFILIWIQHQQHGPAPLDYGLRPWEVGRDIINNTILDNYRNHFIVGHNLSTYVTSSYVICAHPLIEFSKHITTVFPTAKQPRTFSS